MYWDLASTSWIRLGTWILIYWNYMDLPGYVGLSSSVWIFLGLLGSSWIYLEVWGLVWTYLDHLGTEILIY